MEAPTRKDRIVKLCSDKIRDTVLEYLRDSENRNKILHIHMPYGSGKTTTIAKLFFSTERTTNYDELSTRDRTVVWLGPTDKQLEDEVASHSVMHLRGRDKKDASGEYLCRHRLREQLGEYSQHIRERVCERCEYREGCAYKSQIARIFSDEVNRWCGAHQYLSFPEIVKDYLEHGDGVLILDEYFVSALINKIEIEREDLSNHIRVIGDLQSHHTELREATTQLHITLNVLIDILEHNNEGMRDSALINIIREKITSKDIDINAILDRKEDLTNAYTEILVERLSAELQPFKDIIMPLFELLELVRDSATGITPFSVKCGAKKLYSYSKLRVDILPAVPIIILDGSTSPAYYKSILERYSKEFDYLELRDSEIKPWLYVYQVTDGTYPKVSFGLGERGQERTRERLYHFVHSLIRYHTERARVSARAVGKINIVTHLPFSTEDCAPEDARGKTVETYLRDQGVDMDGIRIRHFWSLRGSNEMIDDNIIIILGCPEPNPNDLIDDIAPFYIGDREIDTTRLEHAPASREYYDEKDREEGIRWAGELRVKSEEHGKPHYGAYNWYADKRLRDVQINKREYEIAQIAHRHRPYIAERGVKIVYLITNINIDTYLDALEIIQKRMDEYLRDFGMPTFDEYEHAQLILRIKERILALLREGPHPTMEIMSTVEGKKDYIYKAIEELEREGKIRKSKEGHKIMYALIFPEL